VKRHLVAVRAELHGRELVGMQPFVLLRRVILIFAHSATKRNVCAFFCHNSKTSIKSNLYIIEMPCPGFQVLFRFLSEFLCYTTPSEVRTMEKISFPIGSKTIGGTNRLLLQSMSDHKTSDVAYQVRLTKKLTRMGLDLMRFSVLDSEDAKALSQIKKQVSCSHHRGYPF
jgi:hypothetical protein